jgi:hypothetical protein
MASSLLSSRVSNLATYLPGALLLFSALSAAISAASAPVSDLAGVLATNRPAQAGLCNQPGLYSS